jgi:TFIIF-interacting CTD phosphatase-like protein
MWGLFPWGNFPTSTQSIVIDMDECLIHTFDSKDYPNVYSNVLSTLPVSLRHHVFRVDVEGEVIYGLIRPELTEFLKYCFTRFDYVILWSAGTDEYVKLVCERIFSFTNQMPKHVLTRAFCEYDEDMGVYKKPLVKLSQFSSDLTLNKTFFVDDRDYSGFNNKSNQIIIPGFSPEPTAESIIYELTHDHALADLMEWFELESVQRASDVRTLNKKKIFK